jgi:hypothetical protein
MMTQRSRQPMHEWFKPICHRRKQLCHQKLKHWNNNGHWNDQSYAMIFILLFFLTLFIFMCSHFVKESNPLLSGPKALSKVGTQGKEPDPHKVQNNVCLVLLFGPETKIQKVQYHVYPLPFHWSLSLLHFTLVQVPTSLLLVFLSPFGLQSLC